MSESEFQQPPDEELPVPPEARFDQESEQGNLIQPVAGGADDSPADESLESSADESLEPSADESLEPSADESLEPSADESLESSVDEESLDGVDQLPAAEAAWTAKELAGSLIRKGADGNNLIDALAGRSSVLGFDDPVVSDAIHSAAGEYLGDASAFVDSDLVADGSELQTLIAEVFGAREVFGAGAGDLTHSWFLLPSADLAVETAITLARRFRPQRAFRTVALVGSDHGRSVLGRTASGRPELHEDLGPLVAGFVHVPAGDLDALDVAIDEQTACVLISPNLWSRGGELLDASYLQGVRRLCDERGVLLAVDETQVVFGCTGKPLTISSIAEVRPDLAVFSSGLFGGLPGGITLASERVTGGECQSAGSYPLLASVLSATLSAIHGRGLLESVAAVADSLSVELAERVSRFEFVRDIHVLGLSIGLETDLDSDSLVRAAQQRRVRLEAAGDTAVRIQPPLVLNENDRSLLVDAIEETLGSIQLATADLGV